MTFERQSSLNPFRASKRSDAATSDLILASDIASTSQAIRDYTIPVDHRNQVSVLQKEETRRAHAWCLATPWNAGDQTSNIIKIHSRLFSRIIRLRASATSAHLSFHYIPALWSRSLEVFLDQCRLHPTWKLHKQSFFDLINNPPILYDWPCTKHNNQHPFADHICIRASFARLARLAAFLFPIEISDTEKV